jgi:hypothetical protein
MPPRTKQHPITEPIEMKILTNLCALALVASTGFALSGAQEAAPAAAKPAEAAAAAPAGKSDEAIIAEQLPSYPAGACVVSDEAMGGEHGDPISHVHEGRLYRLCCKSCIKLLAKSPAEYAAKVDAAVVKEQLPSYPLETCPVGGEKLGSAGEPVDLVVGTRLVRLCCAKCEPAVAKDSAAVLAKVNAALIEKQSASYKLETCPVSGEKLGGMGEPMNYLYGTRLVKLCCKGCVKGVTKDPATVLAKLDAAKK